MSESGRIAGIEEHEPLLNAGSNCWHIEPAERVGVIVDAADYFAAFAEACSAAQRQILILGWDFDRRERIYHDDQQRAFPNRFGAFLGALTERRKGLRIYLLSWDFNMIYAAERELLSVMRLRMQSPRLHFRLDSRHPSAASHHQKVVVVDDRVAFVGGIDLTRCRWDTPQHRPDDPRRVDPQGNLYPPFHDVMMVVEGEVAARLGELARERWRRSGGWRIKPPGPVASAPWPPSVEADFSSVPVAIARTVPLYRGCAAVTEVRQLQLDAIAAARRSIYIENQYFTSSRLAGALSKRLAEPEGPEVVLVLPEKSGGWLEQLTMDVLRSRVVANMWLADRHGRLRIYYPHVPGLGERCIGVHAKLLIVDDWLLRIGSANASNRSMGLDTECDLAVEARHPDDAVARSTRALRHRLLAEHLACSIAEVAGAESREGSLIAAIDALRGDGRSLRPLDCRVDADVDELVPDSSLLDPTEPLSPDYFVTEYVPANRRVSGRRRLRAFLILILALLAIAALWTWTPLADWLSPQRIVDLMAGGASPLGRAVLAIAGFAMAALLMLPLILLAVVAGIVFTAWQAFLYLLSGALLAAVLGFFAGRVMPGRTLRWFGVRRVAQLRRQLGRRGAVGVAVLRLVSIATFAEFNLVAGGSELGFRQFILGSLLGLVPGLAAITLFADALWAAIASPGAGNIAIAAAIGAGLAGFVLLARRSLRSG